MIRFENVTIDSLESVSFEIKKGTLCKLLTHSDQERKVLLDSIITFQKPETGEVFIFDKNISLYSESESLNVFKRIGVVLRYGGLMSNLTIWDNITLPITYHMEILPDDIDEKILSIFNQLWDNTSHLSEFLAKPSGSLPVQQRRLIGMVRAMLIDPDLIIYDSLLTGFDKETAEKLVILTEKFHHEKPERTSVFINSEKITEKEFKREEILKWRGDTFTL
ncbi:MAG: ATP-binding cassette domain-containing protein [Candidatus Anammoxibacter sp.]